MKHAKNNSFSTVVFLLITGLLTPSVMAQQAADQPHKFTFYGNLQVGLPRGEFQENVKDMGVGFGLGIGYHLGNSPLMIGAEARYSIYGHETRRQPFQQNPDVFADVETSNSILFLHLLMRLQNNRGRIRPYIDGLLGLSNFFTLTKVRAEPITIEPTPTAPTTSRMNLGNTALSYGAGGGLMILVYHLRDQNDVYDLFLDIRARYLFGGETEYLKEDSSPIGTAIRSHTDLLIFEIGFALTF